MVHYKSKHSSLTFLVGGELKSFSLGSYATDKADEIKVLDALPETERVNVEKPVEVAPVDETPEVPTKKPTRKRSTKKEE